MKEVYGNLLGKHAQFNPNMVGYADYIMEQGTSYTKWASGKLECWGDIRVNHTITIPWESTYYRDINSRTFAQPFTSIPYMIYNYVPETGPLISGVFLSSATTTTQTGLFSIMRPASTSSPSLGWISFHAIGRWK